MVNTLSMNIFVFVIYESSHMSWSRFSGNALRNKEDALDPRASVLRQPSAVGLPPCLLIVAELDPLRDQNYGRNDAYGSKCNKSSL